MILSSSAYNRGSLIDQVTNQLYSTTGKFARSLGRLCIALSSGQNITYAYTGTVYGISLYIKKRGDTTLVKDDSTTKVSITSGAIVATGSSRIFVDGVIGTALKQDTWQHVYIEYASGLTLATNYKIEVSNYTLIGNSRLHTLLTDSEIANEYEYFQSLTSPVDATHFKYKPKANQLKDELVWSAYRAKGQTIIDEVGGNNAVRSSGFIDSESPIILKNCRCDLTSSISVGISFSTAWNINIIKQTVGYSTQLTVGLIIYFSTISTTNCRFTIVFASGRSIIIGSNSVLNINRELKPVLIFDDVNVSLYVNGTYIETVQRNVLDSIPYNIVAISANNGINPSTTFKDISIYNRPLTAAEALAYHKQFEYVTLHETFENNAVGEIYGDPYLTNARPTVSELTTAQYGYEVGKKYLASSGATAKFAYLKQSEAFGTYKNYHVFDSFTGVVQIVYVSANRNNATATTVNGYYLEISGTNRTIAIKRSGATQLLISSNNIFNFGAFVKIQVQRTVAGVQTLLVNDVVIGSTAADLTWLTSENMRIPTQYTSTFEIKQIVN